MEVTIALRRCEHGRWDTHAERVDRKWVGCPGGEFLVNNNETVWWCEQHQTCKSTCDLADSVGLYPPAGIEHRFVPMELVLLVPDPPSV